MDGQPLGDAGRLPLSQVSGSGDGAARAATSCCAARCPDAGRARPVRCLAPAERRPRYLDLHERRSVPDAWRPSPPPSPSRPPRATRSSGRSSASPTSCRSGSARTWRSSPSTARSKLAISGSPRSLQRTTEGTEAIQLLLSHAFDELGYRRVEWKCNALNARSRAAAERFGFRFEGIFAQHRVVKGRNRDTAWYAITDDRWPDLREAYAAMAEPCELRRRRASSADRCGR